MVWLMMTTATNGDDESSLSDLKSHCVLSAVTATAAAVVVVAAAAAAATAVDVVVVVAANTQ